MKPSKKLHVSLLLLFLFPPLGALGAENSGDADRLDLARSAGYIGALLGAGLPAGNLRSDASTNVGLTVGGRLSPNLGLGIWGVYFGQRDAGTVFGLPAGTATSNFNVAGQVNGYVSVFHFGADVGVAVNSWSISAGSLGLGNSNTALIYGPEIGLDIPLGSSNPHLSIGGEAHYLLTNAAGGQSNFLALAALKLWM